MWKSKWRMSKEKWGILMAAGAALLILAMPADGGKEDAAAAEEDAAGFKSRTAVSEAEMGEAAASENGNSYEADLERRVRELLSRVDGVGAVDVMVVLKSSGEKVLHLDTASRSSSTEETDSSGAVRRLREGEESRTAVLEGEAGGGQTPIVAKELYPEISGIVISAEGGGDPGVKAEITGAMEALFGLPAHKISVLKRSP